MNTLIVALTRRELAELSSGWSRETVSGGLRIVVCLEEKIEEVERRLDEEENQCSG
jgi:hypothetical protein